MRLHASSRLESLLSFGLSETCARVYLALIDQPSMTATSLASAAKVPRSHLYTIIQDLQADGLAEIIVEETRRSYRAKPVDAYLARREAELRREMEATHNARRTLAPALEPPAMLPSTEAGGELRVVIGRRAVAREIDSMLAAAQREIVIATSENSGTRMARHLRRWRAEHPAEGIRILLYHGDSSAEWIEPDTAHDQHVTVRRLMRARKAIAVAVDRERILLIHPLPDTPDERTGRDFGVLTANATIAGSYIDLLEDAARTDA